MGVLCGVLGEEIEWVLGVVCEWLGEEIGWVCVAVRTRDAPGRRVQGSNTGDIQRASPQGGGTDA